MLQYFAALTATLVLALACRGGDDGDATSNATADTSMPGPGDPGYVEGDAYNDSDYYCCADGTFPGCCEEKKDGFCYAYGGAAGGCSAVGEFVEGKDICSHCCQGLDRVSPREPGMGPDADADGCVSTAFFSLFVCVKCGDGLCGEGENRCICPADCDQ